MAFETATFEDYLQCRDKAGRLQILAKVRQCGASLPITLVEVFLCLGSGADEKLALLECAGSKDGRALEHFLTEGLAAWSQELAAASVRLWSQRTDHLLWFRILTTLRLPHVPQRVFYSIIDQAFHTGGAQLVRAAATADGLEEMSAALHGLLLHRAVQWNVQTPRLDALALSGLQDLGRHLHPDNKALPSVLAYLARFQPGEVRALLPRAAISEPWRDVVRSLLSQIDDREKQHEKVTKLLAKPPKAKAALAERLVQLWPPLWQRHSADAAMVQAALAAAHAAGADWPESSVSYGWEFFAGIPDQTLVAGLALVPADDPRAYAASVTRLGGLLTVPATPALLSQVKARIAGAADPAALLQKLPLRLRLELTEGEAKAAGGRPTAFQLVKHEETAVLAGEAAPPRAVFKDPGVEDAQALASRRAFFDVAYRGAKMVPPPSSSGFFALLADAWIAPADAKLAPLAQAARQVEGVFRVCYLNTLGRFKGFDQAALKTLDFIRSKEEDDLRAVLHSLGGIGTPRAAQELVASLTRPNITPALQLDLCQILQKQDVANLQNELRSALGDISVKPNVDSGAWDVRDAIASLLSPGTARSPAGGPSPMASDQQLDQALAGKIPHYRELSSEVKRALRTSEFFHVQVSGDSAPESIDLSPVVDMQYKALELLFRETFEEACSRLINHGILQRRLDIIGYARPIPRAMDDFETYVASLPLVHDIPFFSKFKLRKMLRAITQYRPGKRFTLDGLKAFALFFLCFSRSECRYGLAGLFPVGLGNDRELYEFVRALHIHQDVRNRAAHEGFHPDASSDIDGIWRATAEIVQTAFKIKAFLEAGDRDEYRPRNRSTPIVEKKVS